MIQVYCTQIFNTHTKFLRQPATWQAETGLYMARLWSITLPCGNSWKWIKIAIQCTSDFRQFSSIHVISPWCIHLWIRLLALCDLDAGMHAWMHEWMDGLMQQMDASVHCSYIVRHCGMSSSSFRWRLCCWERHWLKSSASCGHLSSPLTALVPTSRVQTNPNKLQIRPNSAQSSTSRPHHTATTCHIMSVYQNRSDLSGSTINDTTTNMIKTKEQRDHTNNNSTKYQTTTPLHLSVSTPFYFYPAFLQLPLSLTKLHRQKVPTFAIWIPTPPVFASLFASIARNLRLLPVLLQLLVRCPPWP